MSLQGPAPKLPDWSVSVTFHVSYFLFIHVFVTFDVSYFLFVHVFVNSAVSLVIFSSPVGSLCHTRGVVRRPSCVVRRVSSVSTITTRNN